MVKDVIEMENIGLKGLVTVELFDAETGKLESKTQKENFIAVGNKMYWAKLQRDSIINQMPSVLKNMVHNNEFFPTEFFNRIILTDIDAPEEPEKEKIGLGNVIGSVDIRGVSTSAHEVAGVLNLNESYVGREKIKIVGDFGTDRGNGSFQSVGFANIRGGLNDYSDYLYDWAGYSEILSRGTSDGGSGNASTRIGNKLYHIRLNTSSTSNAEVNEFDLSNPEAGMSKSFTITGSRPYTGLTNDGGNLWVSRYNHQLLKLSWGGELDVTLNTEIPSIEGIYFDIDEDVFYVTSGSLSGTNSIGMAWNTCIYKINKNTGDTIEILPQVISNTNYKLCDRLKDGTFVSYSTSSGSPDVAFQNLSKGVFSYSRFLGGSGGTTLCNDGNDNFYSVFLSNLTSYGVFKRHLSAINSRVLLPSPQVKNNTQTMKVTYELYYTDWTNIID